MVSKIPEFNDLSCYSDPAAQVARYEKLIQLFTEKFGKSLDFVARSPGRVNLIGEHIDYCYFSVLPMAINVDVVMAVAGTDDTIIRLANMDSVFEPREFELPQNGSLVPIDTTVSDWANYFKCGHLVAQKFIQEKYPDRVGKPLKGMNVLTHGNVPTGGGLSSSAAFACAASLAVLRVNGIIDISKDDLTKMTVVSEHYVGVNTGGMDQCASVCGEKDHALYVEFRPKLKATAFGFPQTTPPLAFLIANTLVTSNKHETASTNYNLRVVEVSLASEVLATKFGLKLVPDSSLSTGTLRGFMDAYYATQFGAASWDGEIEEGRKRLSKMLEIIEEVFTFKDGYTTKQAEQNMNITTEGFHTKFLAQFTVRYEKLQLYARAKHVYSEALRVLESLALLQSSPADPVEFFEKLGCLMNQSQESCDQFFNCSCPEIGSVCQIARSHGSYGSRLTGAGFGGSTVHLTTMDQVNTVKKALIEEYYLKKFPGITEEEINKAIVVSRPAVGSSFYNGGRDGLTF
ncbi:Galactokinase [Nadsonia fulvescens var. elongata DSM 6958]|uniref:Galactokinase n=1 Tax=Nadsonia fulvescens var. elongata DSM 6958 TaxID=857566 RepID=A0A1E3PUP2_9ASCO|nr:Galactokinase [Nadsonia fulvescens var. elongata DSM 6958]